VQDDAELQGDTHQPAESYPDVQGALPPSYPVEPDGPRHKPRLPVGGSLRPWFALGSGLVLLVLLIIFVAENSGSVTVSFLGSRGSISLALALLIAAVVGAAVTLLIGVASVLRARMRARRLGRG